MKKLIAIILILTFCTSTFTIVSAANVCTQISGNCTSEKTFTVESGNRPILSEKITLTQTKGKYTYRPALSTSTRLKTKSGYMGYTVYYKKIGDNNWKSKNWTGKNCTLTLKKNSQYSIRVVPYSTTKFNRKFGVSLQYWNKNATWKVSKTKGINLCN